MAQNWVEHALERTGWRPQNQVVTLILLAIIITLIFGGIYLSQVANFAILNRDTTELIAQRDDLERRNEEFRAEIAELETMPQLLERAQNLGFRLADGADIEYMVVAGYNPERDITNAPIARIEEIQEEVVYDETFGGWLQAQLDSLRQQFNTFGQ